MRGSFGKLIAAATLLLAMASSWAADVRMSVEPQLISLLDRAVLKIEFIDTKGDAVEIPPIDGLQIDYRGPQTQYSFINGRSTSSITHTYVVTPTKVGDYTIGPVRIRYKGGEKEVSAQLRVIKKTDDAEAQKISEIMFSRISCGQDSPYVHEPFDLELEVYIRDGVQIDGNFSLRGGIPESGMSGELKWDLTGPRREVCNGSIFNIYTLRTTAETLTAGQFTFRPEIQVNVVVPRQNRRTYGFNDPFFGDFFGRQETRPIVLDCNALDIDVLPVPTEQRPKSYTGGVGTFDFNVDVGPTRVQVGEPITVKMRISGSGNINQITPPSMAGNPGFKVYEPRSLPAQDSNEVRFEQVVIPSTDSATNLPPISFSYFNTKTTDFRTITRGPFPITVEAAPQGMAQVIATAPSTIQPETKVLGQDIVYLKSAPASWRTSSNREWFHSKILDILLCIPALCLAFVAIATGKRNALANDVVRARRQKAPKAARQHIQLAEQAMKRNDASAFHEALWTALAEYFGHRLNLAPGEVTLQTVLRHIPQESSSLESLFNTVEQRRYGFAGGDHTREEMKALLQQMNETLKRCERTKR